MFVLYPEAELRGFVATVEKLMAAENVAPPSVLTDSKNGSEGEPASQMAKSLPAPFAIEDKPNAGTIKDVLRASSAPQSLLPLYFLTLYAYRFYESARRCTNCKFFRHF